MPSQALVIAALIVQYGIPAAEQIWKAIASATKDRDDPSPEMWEALRVINSNTIEKQLATG